MDQPHPSAFVAALDDYARRWPREARLASVFRALAAQRGPGRADPYGRERLRGHFTGSAWLVDAGGGRVLLTHHRKLDRWLQPGGHADGDRDLPRVALREAGEESGLPGLVLEPRIFDIDRHRIPARGDEPAHWHYDVRYVVRAGAEEAFVVGDESHALAWRPIAALAGDEGADPSLRRMARKWLAAQGAGG